MKSENISLSNYLDTLQMKGQYVFSRKKVLASLSIPEFAFNKALQRLAKKGRVRRARADFYTIVPLEYQGQGTLPVTWFIDDFMRSLSINYYVSILSSAALHGAAHQQPMVFQVVADRIYQPIALGRLRLEFHYKKEIQPVFYSSVKTETGFMQVATPEMTACDLLRYINAAGQINNVATVLIELAEKIDIEKLCEYARAGWIEVATVQRLGYLLELLGTNLILDDLATWIKSQSPHYRFLVTGHNVSIIERNKRWYISVNERVEPDL